MSDQTPRVVVITGASQGIGASLVPAYRKLGYAVVGTSRTIGPSDDPDDRHGCRADIATGGHRRARRHSATRLSAFGRIDHADQQRPACSWPSDSRSTPTRITTLVTGVNLGGFFHITPPRRIEHMERAGSGHVVNITTRWSRHADVKGSRRHSRPSPRAGPAAVTKSLATEYAAAGIRVKPRSLARE